MPQGEYLQYGGQAIVEGVMMRSPRYYSVAVRAPDGRIVARTEPVETTWVGRQRWLRWPFVRGTLALLDAMTLGAKAMRFAANVQLAEEYQPAGAVQPSGKQTPESVRNLQVGGALVAGLAIGILLFVFLPNLLAEQLRRFRLTPTQTNLSTEILKILFFLAYVSLIGRMKEIRRIFQYHGAEHKAINALEHGQELTVEVCNRNSRFHPRCGTSFVLVVLLISVVVFAFLGQLPFWARLLSRIVLVPLIAGIGYEFLRLSARNYHRAWVRVLVAPTLWMQQLTTEPPDDSMLEVAILALTRVLAADGVAVEAEPLEGQPVPLAA